MSADAPREGRPRRDVAVLVALFGATVAYLCLLPRVLGMSDEGLYLYEAKRLLDGQVFYRDVFDLITPGAHLVMAGLFRAFGASMTTARVADAVVHGLIVAAVYRLCRMLDVRRDVAAAAALCDPAFFRPAWPVASPHWMSTLLSLLLLGEVLRTPRWSVRAGIAAGLVIAVQQQRGAMMALGAGAILLMETSLSRRVGAGRGWGQLGRRLVGFAAGTTAVLAPLAVFMVATAGLGPVIEALVVHPLVNYRGQAAGAPWGYIGPFGWFARHSVPRLLPWQPLLGAGEGVRTVVELRGRADPERTRRSMVLAIMSAAWVGSILYFPDYIHLAIIGPVFAVILADLLVWAGRGIVPAPRRARLVAGVGAAAAGVGLAVQLSRVFTGSWSDFPIARTTPFGSMHFRDEREVERFEAIRGALVRAGTDELFVYPAGAGMYLLTGATNPTPYQFLAPGYSRPDQMQEVVTILERRAVPYVVVLVDLGPGDLVSEYLGRHYAADPEVPYLRRRIGAAASGRTSG